MIVAGMEVQGTDDMGPTPQCSFSVLMDHEYELNTPWRELLVDGMTDSGVDSATELLGVDSHEIVEDMSTYSTNRVGREIELENPPSPTTASLQQLLELACKEAQIEGQEIIPYDQHRISVNEHHDVHDPYLDILGEIEANSISSSMSLTSISKDTTNELSADDTGLLNSICDQHSDCGITKFMTPSEPSMSYPKRRIGTDAFMKDPTERKGRFKSGLKYLSEKIRRLRMRTGAISTANAEFEGVYYFLNGSSNSFRTSDKDRWESNNNGVFSTEELSISEEPGDADDHRYAARIITQSSLSTPVLDHQYEDRSLLSSVDHPKSTSKPSFEKRYYERNKAFQRHLHVIFGDVIKKLEDQTGATVSLTVYYQNEVFTKSNYKESAHIFRKKLRVSNYPDVGTKKLTHNERANLTPNMKRLKPVRFYLPIRHQNQQKPSSFRAYKLEPRFGRGGDSLNSQNKSSQKTKLPDESNTIPVCRKCCSSTPSQLENTENGFIGWVRCNDPFCQYIVHAACLGFYISSKETLKRMPPFFCEGHRD